MSNEKQTPDQDQRSMDGLTEVLRLQAEALSRISERMSGMRGTIPEPGPAKLKATPGKSEPQAGIHLPVLSGDPAVTEDSLPILNSFKKFLDDERRQTRKRILWVVLGVTVCFAAVLAVIVWLNSEKVNSLNTDIARQRERTEKTRQDAESELKRVESKATQAVAQNAATLHKDITRNILWAHSVISSNVSSELSGRDNEVDRLKDKISALEVDNTMLTRKLNELSRRVKAVEDDYRDFLERPAQESQLPVAEESAVTNDAGKAEPGIAPLTINSAHFGRAFKLQVPKQ